MQLPGWTDIGDGEALTLFGGFDGDGAETVEVDPCGISPFGEDRQQG
jgi:hypothetical protein